MKVQLGVLDLVSDLDNPRCSGRGAGDSRAARRACRHDNGPFGIVTL